MELVSACQGKSPWRIRAVAWRGCALRTMNCQRWGPSSKPGAWGAVRDAGSPWKASVPKRDGVCSEPPVGDQQLHVPVE